jgi:hypothetical protein
LKLKSVLHSLIVIAYNSSYKSLNSMDANIINTFNNSTNTIWSIVTMLLEAKMVHTGIGPLMSTHASVLVDSVGPPSAEVCRTAASFP